VWWLQLLEAPWDLHPALYSVAGHNCSFTSRNACIDLLLLVQIATIGLAASTDVIGVTLGGILGHAICTGAAVVGGRQLSAHIDERMLSILGGLLFIAFGLHAVWEVSSFSSPSVSRMADCDVWNFTKMLLLLMCEGIRAKVHMFLLQGVPA